MFWVDFIHTLKWAEIPKSAVASLNNIHFNLGKFLFIKSKQTCSARKRAFSQYTRVTNSIQPSSNKSLCEDANDSCNRSPKKWVPGKSGPNFPFTEAAGQFRGETANQLISFYHKVASTPWKEPHIIVFQKYWSTLRQTTDRPIKYRSERYSLRKNSFKIQWIPGNISSYTLSVFKVWRK